VGANRSRSRRGPERASPGRHFLAPRFAAELVRAFAVGPDELVVEVGAGSGRLTRELARAAGLVLAVELGPDLARQLLRSASSWPNVYVHQGDALDAAFPTVPFRLVGNIPFGITTGLLRAVAATPQARRLDLITQLEPARKRADIRGSVLSVVWGVTWEFELRRRIPARHFHPRPSVDGAWLGGRRRPEPLVDRESLPAFERFVRRGFSRADAPVVRTLPFARGPIRAAGIDRDARAVDLTAGEWAAVFRRLRS
jgi:23S rRNA (adenine-N6)-dimethyltransferase